MGLFSKIKRETVRIVHQTAPILPFVAPICPPVAALAAAIAIAENPKNALPAIAGVIAPELGVAVSVAANPKNALPTIARVIAPELGVAVSVAQNPKNALPAIAGVIAPDLGVVVTVAQNPQQALPTIVGAIALPASHATATNQINGAVPLWIEPGVIAGDAIITNNDRHFQPHVVRPPFSIGAEPFYLDETDGKGDTTTSRDPDMHLIPNYVRRQRELEV